MLVRTDQMCIPTKINGITILNELYLDWFALQFTFTSIKFSIFVLRNNYLFYLASTKKKARSNNKTRPFWNKNKSISISEAWTNRALSPPLPAGTTTLLRNPVEVPVHSGLVIAFVLARGRAICRPPCFIAASATLNAELPRRSPPPKRKSGNRQIPSFDTDILAVTPSSPPSYRDFPPDGGERGGVGSNHRPDPFRVVEEW